ncbi:MAG: hypothetical protein ING75_10885 [Rhodocyclaceae bacterium]|nr:hypothetical protein [Rhodocyclaceae bacterium]
MKDIDFAHRAILIRKGKGFKDRVVMLPQSLEAPLKAQLENARAIWPQDVTTDKAGVLMPYALER